MCARVVEVVVVEQAPPARSGQACGDAADVRRQQQQPSVRLQDAMDRLQRVRADRSDARSTSAITTASKLAAGRFAVSRRPVLTSSWFASRAYCEAQADISTPCTVKPRSRAATRRKPHRAADIEQMSARRDQAEQAMRIGDALRCLLEVVRVGGVLVVDRRRVVQRQRHHAAVRCSVHARAPGGARCG